MKNMNLYMKKRFVLYVFSYEKYGFNLFCYVIVLLCKLYFNKVRAQKTFKLSTKTTKQPLNNCFLKQRSYCNHVIHKIIVLKII